LIGGQGVAALQGMVEQSRQLKAGVLAGTIALLTLPLGATGVFAELRSFYYGAELTQLHARRHGPRSGQPQPAPRE
jgi:hypothetical protein